MDVRARRRGPEVSGVSPRDGPPGTLITVRGEYLGEDLRDLVSVKVGTYERILTVEWKSSRKITVRSGQGMGVGDIIITTKSGGTGTSSVTFTGYQQTSVGPTQNSTTFIDEEKTFLTVWDRNRPVAETLIEPDNLLGLSKEDSGSPQPKVTESQLRETFPDNSGDISSSSFSPEWYLLENHSGNSFAELKAGLQHLRSREVRHSEEPMTFVKINLGTFMDCQDALVTMHNMLVMDENQKSLSLDKLTMLLQAADKDADSLFHDIISRKEKSDRTRNVLSIIMRFKFLFHLPPNIRQKIKDGDYDQVVIDYTRAKLLFKESDVKLFRTVYDTVEGEINQFKKSLHESLLEMPAVGEQKKKIIRHLVDLEYAGNAAWECISHQYKWMSDVLRDCTNDYAAVERDEVEYGVRNRTSGGSFKPIIFVPGSAGSRKKLSSLTSQSPGTVKVEASLPKLKTPYRVLYVEELSAKLMENFSTFFKLGNDYFHGQLLRKDKEESNKLKNERQQLYMTFKQSISQLLQLYSRLIRRALLPESLPKEEKIDRQLGDWSLSKSDLPSSWLPQCVRTVRQTAESIRGELPSDSQLSSLLQELVFDLRTDAMRTILKQAIESVSQLHEKETWALESSESSGSITRLPGTFEQCVTESVTHLNDVVIKLKAGETDIFHDQATQEQATQLCMEIIKAYIQALDVCAFGTGNELATPTTLVDNPFRSGSILHDTVSSVKTSASQESLSKLSVSRETSRRRKIVITLSNCEYSATKVMPRLIEMLDNHGYQETDKVMRYAEGGFEELHEKLFDRYVELVVEPILSNMEANMYAGQFEWSSAKEPLRVRDYIKHAVTGLVSAHAEMFSILSERHVPRLLSEIVLLVTEELHRLIFSIPKFNKNGALQARIDLMAYEQSMHNCLSSQSRELVNEAVDRVPRSKPGKDELKLQKLLADFNKLFSIHLFTFKYIDICG